MTIAATVSGPQAGSTTKLRESAATTPRGGQRLSRGQTAAVTVSITLGVAVAGYGLVGSYLAISELAARHEVPLPSWVPAGIDGGLVAVVVLDLVLTWVGTPVGWLRQVVRVLSVGTVAAEHCHRLA